MVILTPTVREMEPQNLTSFFCNKAYWLFKGFSTIFNFFMHWFVYMNRFLWQYAGRFIHIHKNIYLIYFCVFQNQSAHLKCFFVIKDNFTVVQIPFLITINKKTYFVFVLGQIRHSIMSKQLWRFVQAWSFYSEMLF